MKEEMKKLQEYLYQEQWTRATFDTFSVNSFGTIDSLLERTTPEDKQAILELTETYLNNNKSSICALYIAGIIDLQQNSINDQHISNLIDASIEKNKWHIAEHLCMRVLDIKNSLKFLRKLDEVYAATQQNAKQIKIWEKIVTEDFEEADILVKLAQYKLETNAAREGKQDLRKALNRFLHQKKFPEIKSTWNLLLEKETETEIQNMNFFLYYILKIENSLGLDKTKELYISMLEKLPEDYDADVRIGILKNLLRIESENITFREQLVEEYKKKYKNHEKLEDFIRMTNLGQPWRNVQEAISDFEKHVSFFPGSFVYHNKWGIGRIKETSHLSLLIDFSKKRNHQMDIAMAVLSLEVLPKTHFWVLRSALARDKLRERVINSPEWTLKCILKSLGSADIKTLKTELVPDILNPKEWTTWSIKARKILNTNHHFGILSGKVDHYTFSDIVVSPMEKFHKLMQIEARFIGKVRLFRKAFKLIKNSQSQDDLEFCWLMFDFFFSYIQNENNLPDENYISSLFVCEEAVSTLPSYARKLTIPTKEVISSLDLPELTNILKKMKIADYRFRLFLSIKEYKEDWKNLYIHLFPFFPNESILEQLEEAEEFKVLEKIYLNIYENPTKYREASIWFSTSLKKERKWIQDISSVMRIHSNLLRIAITIVRDIANKHNIPKNKLHLQNIQKFLFKENNLPAIIDTLNEQEITYIYSLISQLNDVMPNEILTIRERILTRFPDFEFNDQFSFEETGSSGFFTTEESFKKKQQELIHINEVDLPTNSKEIEKARSFGDLRENAEYKAALEHQSMLNNRVNQLIQELDQARIFKSGSTATPTMVGFGTKVLLEEKKENGTSKKDEFIILGPWESNPEKGIISYLSPFGQKLYKQKLHEICEFSINNTKRTIKILDIQKIDPVAFLSQ